jgi:hypothetical protein
MQGIGMSAVTPYTAHREWATRPPDQRYASVEVLHDAARARRNGTMERDIETGEFRTDAAGDERLVILEATGRTAALTHWSFEQLATMNTFVKIIRNGHMAPGKLAEAELHFSGGELDGLKLIGFAIWARRDGTGQNVTFPARQFTAHGQRRSFSLLRAIDDPTAQERVRELVLQAYRAHAQEIESASLS